MSGFPFFISELNRAMISDDAFDSMRLSGALAQTKASPFSCSFWTPNYCDMGMFSAMPFYTPVMNHLLDPNLAIWQSQNSMQNGCFDAFNGGFGGFGTGFSDMGASNIGPMGTMMGNMWNFGGFGGGMGGVGMGGMFPGQQGGSVGGSGKTQAEKIANNEYNSLKTSAQKIANIKGLDPNVKSTLTAALNKGGTIEEKKQALKDAIATIGDKNIFKEAAIVDFKEDLAKIGYSFPTLKYFESGSTSTNDAKNVHHFVDELEVNLQQEGGDVDKLLSACGKNIIPVISYWNDNSSHENIIKFLAHQGGKSIPSDETKKTKTANAINLMAQALESEAGNLCSENSEGTTNLKSAKNALASARAKLNLEGKLTEEQVNNLADAFNKLYVQIRMYRAQKVRNEVLKKYESLNDLEKGLIPDDIIVAETIEDLKREGFAAPTSYDRISRPKKAEVTITAEKSDLDNKPAKSQISGLVSNKSITKTDNKDVYVSETVDGKKYYTIAKKDGKDVLVEAKGITSIDAEGKINGEYATVEEAIEAQKVTVEEITPTVVQNRVQTKATVDKLKESGDIVLQKGGGYRSKNKGVDGTEYYEINADGAFVKKGTNELVTSVPDENTFMDAQQEKLNRLISEGKIEQITNMTGGRKDIYRSTARDKYGHYHFFIMHPRLGLKRVPGIELYIGGTVDMVGKDGIKHQRHINAIKDEEFWSVKEDEIPFKKETTQAENTQKTDTENTNEKVAENENTKEQEIANEENGAYALGYQVAEDLVGYTNSDELKSVKNSLKTVTSNNVKDFLDGYYSHNGGGNGLFKQLGLETTHLKNEDVVPVMQAALDAVPSEYKDTKEWKEADRICKLYKKKPNKDDFKSTDWGWGWNRIFGEDQLHKFDKAIQKLLEINGKTVDE